MISRVMLAAALVFAVPVAVRAQPAPDPLAAYYGNTIVCARGTDGADACHLWLARDGSFILFGDGMQIGHPGHYRVGPPRPDGLLPVCLFLDTRGVEIAPELQPAATSPSSAETVSGAAKPAEAALLARFHDGLCYALGPHAVGDHWTVVDDPVPAPPAHPDQMFLLSGHR